MAADVRVAGAVLGVSFETTYSSLGRIRVECDLNERTLELYDPRLYRHAFTEQGCASAVYRADLRFVPLHGGLFSRVRCRTIPARLEP